MKIMMMGVQGNAISGLDVATRYFRAGADKAAIAGMRADGGAWHGHGMGVVHLAWHGDGMRMGVVHLHCTDSRLWPV